ncbi:MAG: DUF2135 domain-containing protein [Victivallales bacterium]|nr:DUF2135 domain-containing protein [Victivallales bacterium]
MRLLTVCCIASLALFAQGNNKNIIPRPPIPRPPIIIEPIVIKLPPEVQAQPIEVRAVDIRAAVNGVHAETTMTLTFYNPNQRVLEGELYFPLPTDATVSGYALDINGQLVDGVIVEKEKARVVFEELVRQGIDPGLVEQSAGNVFKTRVYPLPAGGTRKIRVKYVSKVDIVKEGNDYATYYKQPLRFEKPLNSFKLRIEVAAAQKAPQVREGKFSNLSFNTWQNLYVAETELKDIALSEDLNVSIMTAPLQSAVAEKATDGNCYFAVDALLEPPAATAKEAPSIVLWDASASREKTDHDAEFAFLEKILPQNQQLTLLGFRDRPMQPAVFNSPADLIAAIKRIPFDGASNIAAAIAATPVNANVILCSDGLDNFGPDLKTVDIAQRQITAIFQDRDQNITSLRRLTQKAGGQVIDLRTLGLDDAIATFNAPGLAVSTIFLDGKDIANECQSRLESGKLAVAGLLPEGAHKLDVIIKSSGKQQTLNFNLNTTDAPKGSLLRTNYGQMLIASLIADNAAEDTVTATGKQFGLVTPNTSLLVLDTLEQYVRYRVRPPETLPDMRKQYDERIAREGKTDNPEPGQLVPNDMNHVKQIWNALVDWHKKRDFAAVGATKEFMEASADGAAPAERPGIVRRALNAITPTARAERAGARPQVQPLFFNRDLAAAAPMAMEDGAVEVAREEAAPARALAKQAAEPSAPPAARTAIQAWKPSAPYLDDLRKAAKGKAYETYLTLRKTYGDAPGFFMDCADFFATELKNKLTAVTVLSNLAELELENRQILRILGYKLRFFGELESAEQIFRKVLAMAKEEPQSYRDLALVLDELGKYQEAIDLLFVIVNNKFNSRFPEIENIALNEINRIAERAKRQNVAIKEIPAEFRHLIDVDIRVVINWDTDMTDMDLWVTDPFKEKCMYSHRFTATGGRNSPDFTQGYGPEEFMIRNAKKGDYVIETDYYGSHSQKVIGPVTLYAEVFTNYGRPDETHQTLSFRLGERKQVVKVGVVSHTGENRPYPHDKPFQYQIKKGDTLLTIAARELGDTKRVNEILDLNPGIDPERLRVGAIINLPATK